MTERVRFLQPQISIVLVKEPLCMKFPAWLKVKVSKLHRFLLHERISRFPRPFTVIRVNQGFKTPFLDVIKVVHVVPEQQQPGLIFLEMESSEGSSNILKVNYSLTAK